jgi:fatty-acyl-CoA synthase
MDGFMMDTPLTLTSILERTRRLYGTREIVTQGVVGIHRYTYGEFYKRVCRLAHVLRHLGVKRGDRVATLAWNTHTHLEAYYAAPCSGAVLHALNLRLTPEQISYIARHAEDSILLADQSLIPLAAKLRDQVPGMREIVVMNEETPLSYPFPVLHYEDLLASAPESFDWPQLEEKEAASICYTSGTTGQPKGCLYSHRSLFLHAMALNLASIFGTTENDVLLPIVPMFHVNAWGIPYSAPMEGAKLVLPGPNLTPRALADMIQQERVTLAAGVPTIWIGLLSVLEQGHHDLSSLRMVISGGAAIPQSILETYQKKYGIRICQAWGMTETSPLGTISRLRGSMEDWPENKRFEYLSMQGVPVPGIEIRAMDAEGGEVPWDGKSIGELQIRGPWVIREYYREPDGAASFVDGWLRTGDVVKITSEGYMRIVDRAKDLIKSGGEWISSIELESVIMAHPGVLEAAVIAVPHEKWLERPLACVVPKPDFAGNLAQADILEFLRPRVARLCLPDEVLFVESLPKTSTGKLNKRKLREQYAKRISIFGNPLD